jgi:hypothetical protein
MHWFPKHGKNMDIFRADVKAEMNKLGWKDILKLATDSPDKWLTAIDVAVNAAKADGDLGPLEIFKYLPTLIEKVYRKGCESK